jgi:hypothetical protein
MSRGYGGNVFAANAMCNRLERELKESRARELPKGKIAVEVDVLTDAIAFLRGLAEDAWTDRDKARELLRRLTLSLL